jgi:hypothetical protein
MGIPWSHRNLEPNTGTVNLNDPDELAYWAEQFQISTGELKAAALLQGNSIAEIKKYLSI